MKNTTWLKQKNLKYEILNISRKSNKLTSIVNGYEM